VADNAPIPIVDAHHHVWDLTAHAQPWLASDDALAPLLRNFSTSDLAPLAAEAGVASTVVVQTLTEAGETPELLALALGDPLVAAVVGWTDLTAADVTASLAGLHALPGGRYLAGIRHPLMTEPDPHWLDRPDVRCGLAAVAAAGLTFDLVLQPDQLPAAVQAAADLPELTFVLDHLGNVDVGAGLQIDSAWAEAFRNLAALPNTTCKLSGILSEADHGAPSITAAAAEATLSRSPSGGQQASVTHLRPYFDLALASFGPSRLMFGSDWPVCTLTATYARVVAAALALTAELSESDRAAVLADTARAVYRITAS
jgi:L-fuconolactonase